MNKLYGNLRMSWPATLVFAVIAGVYTGFIMMVDKLSGTSFQDIGIYFEWWVIFAVIIVVNCHKWWDAALKCFIFFVISQPVIYAVQIIFGHLDLDMAIYYYRTTWLWATFLTLPGGLIAYFCKSQNLIGAIILGLGNTIQALMGAHYISAFMANPPYHLLSAIVCFGSIFLMSFYIQKHKVYSLISVILPLVLMAILILSGINL